MPIRMKTASTRRPMTRAHIQTRVWLSIGIFVLGFLITAIVSGLERMRAERSLAAIADAVLPAAQDGRDAEAAFLRGAEEFSRSALTEDRSGLDRVMFCLLYTSPSPRDGLLS